MRLRPEQLSLLSLNIEGQKHFDLVKKLIGERKSDVVLFQEVFQPDLEEFSSQLGYKNSLFSPMYRKPYLVGNTTGFVPMGLGLMTSSAIISSEAHYYVGNGDLPVPDYEKTKIALLPRVLTFTEVEKGGVSFNLANTQFTWTPDGKPTSDQFQNIEKVIDILRLYQLRQKTSSVNSRMNTSLNTALAVRLRGNYSDLIGVEFDRDFVLVGDFNAPRGGPIFDRLAAVYTDWIPHEVRTTIDPVLHRAGDLQIVVDGLFSTSSYRASGVEVLCGVSDHCAISARIELIRA